MLEAEDDPLCEAWLTQAHGHTQSTPSAPLAPESFCLETALLLMECSWQAYYVTPQLKKPTGTSSSASAHLHAPTKQSETQPLLKRDTSSSSSSSSESDAGSYFATLMGSSAIPQMDVAQYGLRVVKGFSNAEGDITGYVATDNCKCVYAMCFFRLMNE